MSDQNDRQQNAEDRSADSSNSVSRLDDGKRGADHGADAAGQAERTNFKRHGLDIVGWTAWLTVATAILAVTSIGTFIVLARQLHEMEGQLREMHDSGVDTHNLANSTLDIATATKDFAISTKDLANSTKDISSRALEQTKIMENQLEVFRGELDAVKFQQRANVLVQPNPTPEYILDLAKVGWNINYTNAGGHDAFDLSLKAYMSTNDGSFFRSVLLQSYPLTSKTSAYSTILSHESFSHEQFDQMMSKDLGVSILLQIDYSQSEGGQKMQISRCYSRLKTGAVILLQVDKCEKKIE